MKQQQSEPRLGGRINLMHEIERCSSPIEQIREAYSLKRNGPQWVIIMPAMFALLAAIKLGWL